MAYTKFGEMLRILRIKNHEVMGDLAKVLDVPSSFLSAVENGKKNIPEIWIDKISKHYSLKKMDIDLLIAAAEESKPQYKIDTKGASLEKRQVALKFARSFEGMDDKTALEIFEILSKDD